jgi:hypothetical protein
MFSHNLQKILSLADYFYYPYCFLDFYKETPQTLIFQFYRGTERDFVFDTQKKLCASIKFFLGITIIKKNEI